MRSFANELRVIATLQSQHVPAHSGYPWNECVDSISKQASSRAHAYCCPPLDVLSRCASQVPWPLEPLHAQTLATLVA
eukprot:9172661-Alexandrium_andersonii.AAC.1